MVTDQEIDVFYRKTLAFFRWYFYKASYKPGRIHIAEDLTNEIFVAILKNKNMIDDINHYAWGIIRNKLKMLYRSADFHAEKQPFKDNGEFISIQYDEDALCDILDGNTPRGRARECDMLMGIIESEDLYEYTENG